jgi:hypothetical protein
MADTRAVALAYEKQDSPARQRMCGAAALCMIYRSLGAPVAQADVWRNIARPDAEGNYGARSHLLAADALQRGYAALTVALRQPWAGLRRAMDHGLRMIVNYRLRLSSRAGHFAVVVRVEEHSILLHDPQLGPERRIAQAEFLKLWRPGAGRSEVSGNVLVAIAAARGEQGACRACQAVVPENIRCSTCRESVPLQPASLLGCPGRACPERLWDQVFCPWCDAVLDLSGSNDPVERRP